MINIRLHNYLRVVATRIACLVPTNKASDYHRDFQIFKSNPSERNRCFLSNWITYSSNVPTLPTRSTITQCPSCRCKCETFRSAKARPQSLHPSKTAGMARSRLLLSTSVRACHRRRASARGGAGFARVLKAAERKKTLSAACFESVGTPAICKR